MNAAFYLIVSVTFIVNSAFGLIKYLHLQLIFNFIFTVMNRRITTPNVK